MEQGGLIPGGGGPGSLSKLLKCVVTRLRILTEALEVLQVSVLL